MFFLLSDPQDGEGVEMVKCVFSHLLDMSWQDYDHLLLREIELPDYLFNIVISECTVHVLSLSSLSLLLLLLLLYYYYYYIIIIMDTFMSAPSHIHTQTLPLSL